MAVLGQKFRLQLREPEGTYATVGAMNSFELTLERDTTDVNTFDNPDWREVLPTMKEWSISGDLYYDHSDAGQAVLKAAFASDEAYEFLLTRADGADGAFEFEGLGFIIDRGISGSMNEAVETSLEIIGTGELTETEIVAAT